MSWVMYTRKRFKMAAQYVKDDAMKNEWSKQCKLNNVVKRKEVDIL
jgi:hypothetical protein